MKLKITVHGVAYEVDVQVLEAADEMQGNPPPIPPASPTASPSSPGPPSPGASVATPAPPAPGPAPPVVAEGGGVASPIAGVVMEVKCKVGDVVQKGEILLVIEAMKMETAISAPTHGTVRALHAAAGDSVRENQVLVDLDK